MISPSWQLRTPIDALIFDCDGTLSTLEGIDELAKNNAVSAKVQALTAQAMGKTGLNRELYQERLNLVRPTQEQVLAIGQEYFKHRVPMISELIQAFKALHKTIYIVSAGVEQSVTIFGELLGVARENIFAVPLTFDAEGHYLDFDQHSPLVTNNGKRLIVEQLKQQHSSLLYIGDGLNDCAVYDLVTRFVGYGGAYYRENIAAFCQFYIKCPSMTPLFPLALTADECQTLNGHHQQLYQEGLEAIQKAEVLIKD